MAQGRVAYIKRVTKIRFPHHFPIEEYQLTGINRKFLV